LICSRELANPQINYVYLRGKNSSMPRLFSTGISDTIGTLVPRIYTATLLKYILTLDTIIKHRKLLLLLAIQCKLSVPVTR
jgi:hypothetical protein